MKSKFETLGFLLSTAKNSNYAEHSSKSHTYLSEIRISRCCGKRNRISLVAIIHFCSVWMGQSADKSPEHESSINSILRVSVLYLTFSGRFSLFKLLLAIGLTF